MMKHLYTLATLIFLIPAIDGFAQADGTFKTSGSVALLPDLSVEITKTTDSVFVNLSGPDDRWFAIGFNAQAMIAGTDVAFYGNGSEGVGLYDGRLTGNAPPQADAVQNWTIESENTSEPGIRSFQIKRPLATGDVNDYAFDYNTNSLPIIFAYGASASTNLAFHQNNRGAQVLSFDEVLSDGTTARRLAERISLYPNPSNGPLTLAWEQDLEIEEFRLLDIQAREIKRILPTRRAESIVIETLDLPAGLYYIEVQASSERTLLKFIKQ